MARIRKLDESSPAAELRAERIFTLARLEDEPLGAPFANRFDGWPQKIAELEQSERAIDEEEERVSAALVGANGALDDLCTDLSETLLREVGRDDPRYRAFFKTTCSEFIRQPFDEQVRLIRNWVDTSNDPTFLATRDAFAAAITRAERAQKRQAALATLRANRDITRKALADAFTHDRDVLHDDLAKVARDNRLPRGWAATFFKVGPRSKKKAPDNPPEPT